MNHKHIWKRWKGGKSRKSQKMELTEEHVFRNCKSGQDIKNMLFALIGRPDRIGMKNTPPSYGNTMDEIKTSILRIMKVQGALLPAYGIVSDTVSEEEMARAKKKVAEQAAHNTGGSGDVDVGEGVGGGVEGNDGVIESVKRIPVKKNVAVAAPSSHVHQPLTNFRFPSQNIQFLVNMDIITCDNVQLMEVHTNHKKNYAYDPVSEKYYLIGKDGSVAEEGVGGLM